jgi:alpha-methylacyl-CoA racemase
MLADFGADVVTICRAKKGKVLSQADPVSRGKRSIALDLKQPEGLEVLKKLAATADVFIEPFRPGVCEKMGCGPDVLCGLNPRLIYGRMTGFGQGTNPQAHELQLTKSLRRCCQVGQSLKRWQGTTRITWPCLG